jgi:hypothetical protein
VYAHDLRRGAKYRPLLEDLSHGDIYDGVRVVNRRVTPPSRSNLTYSFPMATRARRSTLRRRRCSGAPGAGPVKRTGPVLSSLDQEGRASGVRSFGTR